MTKLQLIEAMKDLPDDAEILIGANGVYPIESAGLDTEGDGEFIIIADEEHEVLANTWPTIALEERYGSGFSGLDYIIHSSKINLSF